MVREILVKLTAWTPSTFVGFDSIDRDENFLRQALYQTLHRPYLTNCDGNTRADLAKMIQAAILLAPGAVHVPRSGSGEFDSTLCVVASANGITYDQSCTALEAVEGIVQLARRLNGNAPEIWSTGMRFSQKASVIAFVESEPIFSVVEFFYGKPFAWLVVLIGENSDNKAERYVFNLAVDPDDLLELSDEELRLRLSTSPKPVRVLKTNASPMLTTESDAPPSAKGRNLDPSELERRAQVLGADSEFRARIVRAFRGAQRQWPKSSHVEQQLYDGFVPHADLALMELFHRVPWEERPSITSRFKDSRLQCLGLRLIHAEMPGALEVSVRTLHDRAVVNRQLGADGAVPWMTLPKAIEQVDDLIASATPESSPLLRRCRADLLRQIELAQARIAMA